MFHALKWNMNNSNMNWVRKILGFAHSERITMEVIERLPAHKLCRKYIDGELDADIETKEFDNIMCTVELHAEVINGDSTSIITIPMVNVRYVQKTPLLNSEQCKLRMS